LYCESSLLLTSNPTIISLFLISEPFSGVLFMKYINIHLHVNMWYAEYTHGDAIRRFPYIYRELLNVFESHPKMRIGWDIECSITLPYLLSVAPDVIERIKKGVAEGRYEILVDTWSFSLTSLHTKSELEFQINKAINCLREVFGKVSKGFYAQETAYAEPLPEILTKFGFEYILLKKETVDFLTKNVFMPQRLGVYNIVGHNSKKIKAVIFETTYQSLKDFALAKKEALEDESIILILGDAEIFDPGDLDELFHLIESDSEITPILLSEYIQSHKPIADLYLPDCTWVLGSNDFGLWCRDPWDHYLWTLNEKARYLFSHALFWLEKLPSSFREKFQSNLDKILELIALAQNSDKFGWNPCCEKRKEGEALFLNAIYKLDSLIAIMSELVSQKGYLNLLRKEAVKQFLVINNHPEIKNIRVPLSFKFKIERAPLNPNELLLKINNTNLPFALILQENYTDGEFRGEISALINLDDLKAESLLFLMRGAVPDTSCNEYHKSEQKIRTSQLEILFNDDKSSLSLFSNISESIELTGNLFDYSLESDIEPSLKKINISEDFSRPFPIFFRRKINEYYDLMRTETEYRVFSKYPLIEVIRKIVINEPLTGRLNPLTLNITNTSFSRIWRKLIDEIVLREVNDEEIYPLVNDWAILESRDTYLLLAANSLIHSIKEIGSIDKRMFIFSPIETFYDDNPLENLEGRYIFRVLFGIFPKSYSFEKIVDIAEVYTKPPFIINMCQLEGSRKI